VQEVEYSIKIWKYKYSNYLSYNKFDTLNTHFLLMLILLYTVINKGTPII